MTKISCRFCGQTAAAVAASPGSADGTEVLRLTCGHLQRMPGPTDVVLWDKRAQCEVWGRLFHERPANPAD